jgi:hypothetical protein
LSEDWPTFGTSAQGTEDEMNENTGFSYDPNRAMHLTYAKILAKGQTTVVSIVLCQDKIVVSLRK